jgi:hypothetical protein
MSVTEPLLVDTGRGFALFYAQRWLHSRVAPQAAAERIAAALRLEPETLYVLCSPCLCHGLNIILEHLPSSSKVLAIEFDPQLHAIARTACADGGFSRNSRFKLVDSTNPATMVAIASGLGRYRRVHELRLSGGKDLHSAAYDAVIAAMMEDNRTHWRNRMTLLHLGRLWTRNLFSNLGRMRWDTVVDRLAMNRPVLICGAGPSLDRAYDWIRDHASKLYILSVDTAAGALVRMGIKPDAVVCLEAQAHNLPDFTALAGLPLTMASDISAHPAGFGLLTGSKLIMSSRWTECRLLDRLEQAGLPIQFVPPLGSVGVLAAHLAAESGQPLFISGLDFAFRPGQTHCTGSPPQLRMIFVESRLNHQRAAWVASYRSGIMTRPDGSRQDTVLAMYARRTALAIAACTCYDLRQGFGTVLPAMATSFDQASRLLAGVPTVRPGPVAADQPATLSTDKTSAYQKTVRSFLNAELELASRLAGALTDRTTTPSQLDDLITAADYMYMHFPDPERVASRELDALKRLRVEAAYWQQRITMASSFLD